MIDQLKPEAVNRCGQNISSITHQRRQKVRAGPRDARSPATATDAGVHSRADPIRIQVVVQGFDEKQRVLDGRAQCARSQAERAASCGRTWWKCAEPLLE